MRGTAVAIAELGAAADSGEEVDLAVLVHGLEKSLSADFAIDGDGEGRLQLAIFDDLATKSGELAIEIGDELTDGVAGSGDGAFAGGQLTQQ